MNSTSEVYQKALAKRDYLKQQLEEIEGFIATYQRLEKDVGEVKNVPLLPSEIVNIIEQILTKSENPLSLADIVAALMQQGISVNSKNYYRYVGLLLQRNKQRFTKISRKGYSLL